MAELDKNIAKLFVRQPGAWAPQKGREDLVVMFYCYGKGKEIGVLKYLFPNEDIWVSRLEKDASGVQKFNKEVNRRLKMYGDRYFGEEGLGMLSDKEMQKRFTERILEDYIVPYLRKNTNFRKDVYNLRLSELFGGFKPENR
jgi:hypothetical protein